MKKVKRFLSVFIVIVAILTTGSSSKVSAQEQDPKSEDCVLVFSVRCPWTWGDCCYVSSADFNCIQKIC
jgi:hypothetical protein